MRYAIKGGKDQPRTYEQERECYEDAGNTKFAHTPYSRQLREEYHKARLRQFSVYS